MIPLLAVLIAVYGTARLLNDCLAVHAARPRGGDYESVSIGVMWLVSLAAIVGMWGIVILIVASGASLDLGR